MASIISKGPKSMGPRKKSGGPFSFVSPLSKSGMYYYRNPTSYLQLAAEEVGIPLTVKILDGDLTDELRQGEILTMHKILEVVKLTCVKPSGDHFELPVELDATVESIRVDEKQCYHTIGDVLTNQHEEKIHWVVVTKPFVYQGFVYNHGSIFEVLEDGRNNDHAAVEVYPGRLMVFLPTNIRGEFYKIESPARLKKQNLFELKQEEVPMLIKPKLKTFPDEFIKSTNMTNDRLLVVDKKTEKFVIASTYKNEEYYIHIFPLTVEVSCEILLGGVPVDILRQKEVTKVEKKLFSILHHTIDYTMSMTYKTAGIERSKCSKSKSFKHLKKKDITLPEMLLDNEYSRYIAKPTSLMRELGQTLHGPVNEAPTIVRMNTILKRPQKLNNNDEQRNRNRESISSILKKVDLEQYEEVFFNEQIDSNLLTRFDENDFLELGLRLEEVQRLYSSIHSLNKPETVADRAGSVSSEVNESDSNISDLSEDSEIDHSDINELPNSSNIIGLSDYESKSA